MAKTTEKEVKPIIIEKRIVYPLYKGK